MVNVPLNCEKQTKFMKNSKKFYKNQKSSSRPNFHSDEVSSTSGGGGETSLVVETNPPAIAIVAPTARNPTATINHMKQPCKAHSQQQSQLARIINIQPIHHIQQVPITTTPTPSTLTQQPPPPPQSVAWPVVEPAFNFGPGFLEIPGYCPTHSRSHDNQNMILFHIAPGIAASFQIAGIQKIFQGEFSFTLILKYETLAWWKLLQKKRVKVDTQIFSIMIDVIKLSKSHKKLKKFLSIS